MKKYEYKRISLPSNDSIWTRILNEEGLHGWELVQIRTHIDTMAYLKRELINQQSNNYENSRKITHQTPLQSTGNKSGVV